MVVLLRRLAVGGVCALFSAAAAAAPAETPAADDEDAARPIVVEMFLSQSCKSSPPAADVLAELAARPDVVALAWHVDYWDQFAAQEVGPWVDPYARPAFVERQKAYNARIRGRPVVFTPQAVIDGFISVVGSQRLAIERRIVEARFYDEKARPRPPSLELEEADGGMIRTRIDHVGAPYDALLVKFRPSVVTEVEGGDNAGVVFREANVVRAVATLAADREGPGEFSFEAPPNGIGCAVLVQERGHGRIVAARYCRSASEADAP
jgi:hypothetical protein